MKYGNVLAVILAGGLARRMRGVDKSMVEVGGKTSLEHVIERVRPNVGHMIINANQSPERFALYQLPIVEDVVEGFAGPLAGILTAMIYAKHNLPDVTHILSVPVDTPFLPRDLTERFCKALDEKGVQLACARSLDRTHPVIGLWPVCLANELKAAIDGGTRKIDRWTANYNTEEVQFDATSGDPFFNINYPEDVEKAKEYLSS